MKRRIMENIDGVEHVFYENDSIDFVTVAYKRFDYMKVLVRSIEKYVDYPHTIYIVNNGPKKGFDELSEIFKDNDRVKIVEGMEQDEDGKIVDTERFVFTGETKHDKRVVNLDSYAQAVGMEIGIKAGTGKYVCNVEHDVVFLGKWVKDLLPLLIKNVFVSYAWRHDIDQALTPQFSVVERSTLENNYLFEPGDIYPNVHYQDTFGMLSLWARRKDENFCILVNSLNEPGLKSQHVLDVPHGEQGWIEGKPFVYHYGRGGGRNDYLYQLWIEKTNEYLDNN